MNKYIFLLLLFSPAVFSASYTDTAKIISTDKVYKEYTIREPYQECHIKEFYIKKQQNSSITNEILGGIIGGVIGNQFGKGSGKDAMTIAGTILGASVAHDGDTTNATPGETYSKEVCESKYRNRSERRLSNYLVKYKYNNKIFSYSTTRKPSSKKIKVKITVVPQ